MSRVLLVILIAFGLVAGAINLAESPESPVAVDLEVVDDVPDDSDDKDEMSIGNRHDSRVGLSFLIASGSDPHPVLRDAEGPSPRPPRV